MSVISSNNVRLKVPVMPSTGSAYCISTKSPSRATADSTTLTGERERQEDKSKDVSGARTREKGNIEVGAGNGIDGEGEGGGNGESDAKTVEGSREIDKIDIYEGRTMWKGETLQPLRTPLFVFEIGTVGEKGKEKFVYAQRMGALKESALTLIDKAVTSTQVKDVPTELHRLYVGLDMPSKVSIQSSSTTLISATLPRPT